MASAMRRAWRMLASVAPTSEPYRRRCPAAKWAGPPRCPRPRRSNFSRCRERQQQNAAWFDGLARLQGAAAEVLEVGQSAQRIEAFAAAVQGEQVVLLQRLGLEFPDGVGPDGIVSGQGQGEGASAS